MFRAAKLAPRRSPSCSALRFLALGPSAASASASALGPTAAVGRGAASTAASGVELRRGRDGCPRVEEPCRALASGGAGGATPAAVTATGDEDIGEAREAQEHPHPHQHQGRDAAAAAAVPLQHRLARAACGEDDDCAVCLNGIVGGDEVRRLSNCRHAFHRARLDRWMAHDQRTCPLCRAPLIPGAATADPWGTAL